MVCHLATTLVEGTERAAKRIIIRAAWGGDGTCDCAKSVLHDVDGRYSEKANAVLKDCASINPQDSGEGMPDYFRIH